MTAIGTRWYNFYSHVHQPREPEYTASQTDGRSDGRQDYASRRSCVAVRSVKNLKLFFLKALSFQALIRRTACSIPTIPNVITLTGKAKSLIPLFPLNQLLKLTW